MSDAAGRLDSDRSGAAARPADASWLRRSVNALVGSAIFVITGSLVFRYFVQYGKSNVWKNDGLYQHVPALYYVNVWLRGFLANPGAGLPLWSWHLGLGADVIGTLAYYAVGDPFVLLSLLFPMSHLETAYLVLFLLRLACAGVFSALYFRMMGGRPLPIVMGSLIYVFATFTMVGALRHPFWADALVFLPLLLLGVEDVLRKGRPYVLIGAVFLAALANFYFFYMQGIVAVLYAVIRYIDLTPRGERIRRLLPDAGRTAGAFALGLMLASPVMMPALKALLDSSRGGAREPLQLLYSIRDYGSMLAGASLPQAGSHSTYLGFSAIAFVLLPALYMRPGNRSIKWMTGLLAAFIAIPFFGSLFNGFDFPSNRFAFALGLFLACAVVLILSDERPLSRRELLAGAGVCGAFAVVFVLSRVVGHAGHTVRQLVPIAIALLGLAVLSYEAWRRAHARPKRNPTASVTLMRDWAGPLTRWTLLTLVVFGIAANATFSYDRRFSNLLRNWANRGTVLARYLDQKPGILAASVSDPEFFRIDKQRYVYRGSNGMAKANDSLVQGYRGTAMEYSVTNRYLLQFMKELETRDVILSFGYTGFDDRAIPIALLAEKYLVTVPGLEPFVPFGFSAYETSGTLALRRNDWALPLGVVFDAAIPRSAYEPLDALDKQAVLLKGAVVDDQIAASMATTAATSPVVGVPFSVESTSNVQLDLEGGQLTVTRAGGSTTLGFAPVRDAELYVELLDPTYRALKGAPLGQDVRIRYRVGTDAVRKSAQRLLPGSGYYWPNDSQLVNLGYRSEGATSVVVTFQKPMKVRFASLKVLAMPMKEFPAQAARLRASALTDVSFGVNRVSGTVDTRSGGLLFLSIPYSAGWTARVDGAPAAVVRTDTAFTGVPVPPGQHRVELAYFTPWLRPSLAACALGLGAVCAIAAFDVRSRRREGARHRPRGVSKP